MDFLDNVVNKSNAIIKERLNNPFGAKTRADEPAQSEEMGGEKNLQQAGQQEQSAIDAVPSLESTARQHMLSSQDSSASNNNDQNNGDKNSQFAAIAADAEAVAQKAAKGAKNIGSFLFSMANKAGQTVSQTAKQVKQAVENTNIMADFTREQQEFIKEHGGSLQSGQLPWEDCDGDEARAAYMKEQILSLSQDKRNFVRSPPSDSEFKFDPETCYPQALSLLKEDPNLNKLRYELVPKLVKEDTFWCNYFYRVSMLKQMSEKGEKAKQGWASSRSSSGEGPDEMGAGDGITPHGTIDEPMSPGYSSAATASTAAPTATANDRAARQESFNLDKQVASQQQQQQQQQETASGITGGQQQYQPQDFESTESRKLFAEADDLKSKLRELNIGSLDDGNDDDKWEAELQRDLQEFELVSSEDVDAYDEETLQNELMQLRQEATGTSVAEKKEGAKS